MIELNLNIDVESKQSVAHSAAEKLGFPVKNVTILKKSVDARDKGKIRFVYRVGVETEFEEKLVQRGFTRIAPENCAIAQIFDGKSYRGSDRPIVVGMGPCGLFTALSLCALGAKPIILERGERIEKRTETVKRFNQSLNLNRESNVQFGEGGAGSFSDGKLNTGIGGSLVRTVLTEFVSCGAPEEILYENKPHIGTDKLYNVVINMRNRLLEGGAEIHYDTRMTDILTRGNRVCGVRTDKGDFYADRVYLAIGHSARDTVESLYAKNVKMVSKTYSMGVRIEHLQSEINRTQYGKPVKNLPPADYKAAVNIGDGRSLYTFCMCPGGTVINASSEDGGVCINGMSRYLRNGINANSALLVNVTEREFGEGALRGMEYQRALERKFFAVTSSYRPTVQLYGDFVAKRVSSGTGVIKPSVESECTYADLNALLPSFIANGIREGVPLLARKIRGLDTKDAVLTGVEARSSSPVRIMRDENYQSSVENLYPLGEGAGYAGGITSAAADGIRAVLTTNE